MAEPAVGAAYDQARLDVVVSLMGGAAAVITAEGVTPCLHPHVSSWVETEAEVRAVLDGIDQAHLSFGPDTGHLFWAGMDPTAIIAEYADRVRAVHIKDVHRDAAERVRRTGGDYLNAVYSEYIWTEPGYGDVNFDQTLAALPADYDGWYVIEVDNPDHKSKEESALDSARWVARQRSDAAAGSSS
jgi:inosose dehydratase